MQNKIVKLAGFEFTKIVIIKSLEQHESYTARHLHEYVNSQSTEHKRDIPIVLIDCPDFLEFTNILHKLKDECEQLHEIPVVHVECHGNHEGIEFENGSTMSWPDIAKLLAPINLSTRFNLLAVFSACFGGDFGGQMHPTDQAPCWCIVGPNDEINPGEIMRGFRVFYSTLLKELDMGKAVQALSSVSLNIGNWFAVPAEILYQRVVTGYIQRHCTEEAVALRVKKIQRQLQVHTSMDDIRSMMKEKYPVLLTGQYFDRFFMLQELPENRLKFESTRDRLKQEISKLRETGDYII